VEIEIHRSPRPSGQPQPGRRNLITPTLGIPHLDFSTASSFHRGPTRGPKGYRLVLFCLAASLIDILLGFALAALFTLSSSALMHVNFMHLLAFFNHSLLQVFAMSFVVAVALYKITLRVYLGFTVGEWACGIRLGKPAERSSNQYAYRVLLRAAIGFLSGFIVLPIFSLILGEDVAGRISGLYLVSKVD
jgi:hypothetical protein